MAARPMSHGESGAFGRLLSRWRAARRMSQLDLALAASVSARHVSFVETGRSKPSRDMVLLLADVLDVPLRERNDLLEAAGYAAAFSQVGLDAPEMAKVRKVLEYILHGSEPNPTFVLDRRQDVASCNRGMERFLGTFLGNIPPWYAARPNYLRLVFHPDGLRRSIVNWHDVARALLNRLHREAGPLGPDANMRELLDELLSYPGIPTRWGVPEVTSPTSVLVPMHLRHDDLELRLFSTVTTVGSPRDVTVQELRIECFIPADDASERAIESLAR